MDNFVHYLSMVDIFLFKPNAEVYIVNMSMEKANLNIRAICDACGMTISDMNRITSVSRTTLYALDRGDFVRKATVVRLLQTLLSSNRYEAGRQLIRQNLRRLNASGGRRRTAEDIVQALDDLILDVATIHDAPGDFDLGRLQSLTQELDRVVKQL